MKRLTGDLLQNLTGRNISDYLIKTYPQILKKRSYLNSDSIFFFLLELFFTALYVPVFIFFYFESSSMKTKKWVNEFRCVISVFVYTRNTEFMHRVNIIILNELCAGMEDSLWAVKGHRVRQTFVS